MRPSAVRLRNFGAIKEVRFSITCDGDLLDEVLLESGLVVVVAAVCCFVPIMFAERIMFTAGVENDRRFGSNRLNCFEYDSLHASLLPSTTTCRSSFLKLESPCLESSFSFSSSFLFL